MSGTFLVNQPKVGSTTGERTITTGTLSGTYTVNCDGTGVITRAIKRADGTTASSVDDFIITAAVRISMESTFAPVATTVVDSQNDTQRYRPGWPSDSYSHPAAKLIVVWFCQTLPLVFYFGREVA